VDVRPVIFDVLELFGLEVVEPVNADVVNVLEVEMVGFGNVLR
jgi:hypothetical protein